MTPTVFILGTSHPLQRGDAECGIHRIALLERKIRDVLSAHGIRRIAEEMSEDGLCASAGTPESGETVCQRIAPTDVAVDFVDLGRKERACLSFSDFDIAGFAFKHAEGNSEAEEIRESFNVLCGEVRERVWVARVLAGDAWPVLFVCGANHALSVSQLFECVFHVKVATDFT